MLNRSLQYFSGTESNRFKTVTIHRFPTGSEYFINGYREVFMDGHVGTIDLNAPVVARGDGDREKNILRAARRAKTMVRRRCKMIQADCMLTLTYRENMLDPDRMQADFKAFRKRLESLCDFPYVAVMERQQRGAIHLHIACRQFPFMLRDRSGSKVKSYNLIRSIWRSVVGSDNGNIDLTKPRGHNSAHRVASYISKYVAKNIDTATFNKKSYWSSTGIIMPIPETLWFDYDTDMGDLVSMCAHEALANGYRDFAQYQDTALDFNWISASRGENSSRRGLC